MFSSSMSDSLFRYSDMASLDARIALQKNFFLNFEFGKGYENDLKQIIEACRANKSFSGIAFRLDQDRQHFQVLFFLTDEIETLLALGKQVSIWGVPVCVPLTLFSNYISMRITQSKIIKTKKEVLGKRTKLFLAECKHCSMYPSCNGLGKKNIKTFTPHPDQRLSTSLPQITNPFKEGSFLYNKFDIFSQYCRQENNTITSRNIFFVSNIDFGSTHSYSDRLIYSCMSLPPREYKKEFEFLRAQSLNSSYVDLIQSVATIYNNVGIGYSIAQQGGITRESFYMGTTKQYGLALLKDFKIDYIAEKEMAENFYGIGIDVIHSSIICYKLYFDFSINCSDNFCSDNFMNRLGFDIRKLSTKNHSIVLRIDEKFQKISEKIDFAVNSDDLSLFTHLIDNIEYFKMNPDRLSIFNISIEFEDDGMSKINIYHANNVSKDGMNFLGALIRKNEYE